MQWGSKRGVCLSIAFLRDARWLTLKRVNAYASVMIVVTAAIITWALTGPGLDDPAGRIVGADFVSFWTVSWAVLNGYQDTIYVPAALAGLEQAMVPHSNAASFYPWLYPPTGLLVVYPLALLPYLWALGAWLVAGLAGYLTALWRILPYPQTLWAGLGFPAVLVTATHGQNAFLVTALLAWGLLLLRRQPITAGILIGMLSFKPQLGILLPVAMIAGGHGRAVAAAALTVFALSAATILLFGPNAWQEFVANTSFTYMMLNEGLVPYFKFQSVFAAIRLLGGDPVIAYITQAVAAAGAAGVVAWIWRSSSDPDIKSASLLAAMPLATPYLVDYDLLLLAPAIAWTVRNSIRYGALPWEGVTFAVATLLTLIARPIAECTHILFTPAAAAGLLAVIVARSILRGPSPGAELHISRQSLKDNALFRREVSLSYLEPTDRPSRRARDSVSADEGRHACLATQALKLRLASQRYSAIARVYHRFYNTPIAGWRTAPPP